MPQKKKTSKNKKNSKKTVVTTVVSQKASRQPKQAASAKIPAHLTAQVCSLTDPFCDHARNGKIPDASNSKTLTLARRSRFNLQSNAGGAGSVLFLPGYTYFLAVADPTTCTGTFANFSASIFDSLGTSGFSSSDLVDTFRITNWGIKIRNVAAPLASSGIVHIRHMSFLDGDAVSQVMNPATYNCDSYLDIPLQDCHNVTVVGKNSSGTNNLIEVNYVNPIVYPSYPTAWYSDPTTVATSKYSAIASPWLPVMISMSGVPVSSGPLDIEVIAHYEVVFHQNTGFAQLQTPAAKNSPGILSAVSRVREQMPPAFTEAFNAVTSHIANKASVALRDALARRMNPTLMLLDG